MISFIGTLFLIVLSLVKYFIGRAQARNLKGEFKKDNVSTIGKLAYIISDLL